MDHLTQPQIMDHLIAQPGPSPGPPDCPQTMDQPASLVLHLWSWNLICPDIIAELLSQFEYGNKNSYQNCVVPYLIMWLNLHVLSLQEGRWQG